MNNSMICTYASKYLKDKIRAGDVVSARKLNPDQARHIARPQKFISISNENNKFVGLVLLDNDGLGATFTIHSGLTGVQMACFKYYELIK